jgi:alpha-L-arabinofuranosidase
MFARNIVWAVLPATLFIAALDLSAAAQPAREYSLEIDAHEQGEAISPMLFGHNMEVTRRSIFGGLSAEMVSNRKFAALDNGLPKRWSVISSSTRLAMDGQVPYAERASLRVESDGRGGLRQQVDSPLFPKGSWTKSMLRDDYGSDVGGVLAFQEGREYSFRWQLKTDGTDKHVWMRISDRSGANTIGEATMTLKPGAWHTWTGEFSAAGTVENARLEIGGKTAGKLWIGAASIQPSDAFHGLRRDVIELLKEMKPGPLRFPGGCYSDFYQWRDGLLPLDERPVISQGALEFLLTDSDGYDTQELGTDEFIALCRELNCDPAMTIRMWNVPGEPEEALAWVEYCNGGPETKWGKVRIERGHAEPYSVKIWFVGNELAFFGRNGLNQTAHSAPRSRLFAEAMKKADPSLVLVGCTDFTKDGTDEWNKNLMEQAGEYLTYGSYHSYAWGKEEPSDVRSMANASVSVGIACQQLSKNIHRQVTLDEWNTAWGAKGTVAMALHTASMLNRLCRDSKELGISQAYYFHPINEGAITVTPLDAKLDTAGKVFVLYKVHQGSRLLKTPVQPADADLDICASASPDGKSVSVTAVNRNCDSEMPLSLALKNFDPEFRAETTMLVPRSLANTETELIERHETLTPYDGNRVDARLPPCAIARIVFSKGVPGPK